MARGGGSYRIAAENGTNDLAKVAQSIIALGNTAVIAIVHTAEKAVKEIPNVFVLQDSKFDCSKFMSKMAVVVHHGK